MTEFSTTLNNLRETMSDGLQSLVAFLPLAAAALLLLLIGWQIARLMRTATGRLGTAVNSLLLRFRPANRRRRRVQLSPVVVTLVGNLIFWLVILISITLTARVTGLDLFTTWLYAIVAYLPTLLAGGLIVLAGYLVSMVLRDLVAAALESAGSQQGDFFGLLAQSAVFLATLVIGLDQVGIDVSFLTLLFGIVVGGLLLGMALAFGLGARVFVSNLLGAHHIRDQLDIGRHVRIGQVEGEVIDFMPTAVILATADGRVSVPAKLFQEEATLIASADANE